jgi:dGTPase
MARALALNEDLTEAFCLAHDIGHPPFGHSGEDALQEAMRPAGGFDHNAHTLRLLTKLETPYPRHAGLNLTWETLEGLAKHNGPVAEPSWALAEVNSQFPLDLGTWPSLEAQVAAIADDIAYDNHDVDDGLRAGLFSIDDLLEVPLAANCWRGVRDRYSDVEPGRLVPELIRDMIGLMVNDVLQETGRRTASAEVETSDDVRYAGVALAGFSEPMAAEERRLKAFLHARMYGAPPVRSVADEAGRLIGALFSIYLEQPSLLPHEWQGEWENRVAAMRRIGDFIAGMTDRYAIAQYRQHAGPVELPEGF